MPVTYPAHQGPVLAAKLRWPRHIDATAGCLGAAAPDAAFVLGGRLAHESHRLEGAVGFALPLAVLVAVLLRSGAAAHIAPHLPDLGPFRLRSYGVVGRRRPPLAATVLSAAAGVASHLVVDAFTHADRWQATWLGLEQARFRWPLVGVLDGAASLQLVGHVVGTALTLALLAVVGHDRLLERWYGHAEVAAARSRHPSAARRVMFWTTTVVVVAGGTLLAGSAGRPLVVAVVPLVPLGCLLAGALSAATAPAERRVEAALREPEPRVDVTWRSP